MTRRLFIVVGTGEQLATLPPDCAAYQRDGWLVLRPELRRREQLRVIAEVLDDIGFWAPSPTPPVIPTQRFSPVQAFYAGRAAQS